MSAHAAGRPLVAGTRGSALALWQTEHVAAQLRARGVSVDVKVITTEGDVNLAERLAGKIEKGFFTAALEDELRAGTIDFAVHSLKDLPTRLPGDLALAAVLERAAAGDLLIARPEAVQRGGGGLLPLGPGARVGTSSLRRDALLGAFAPASRSLPLRGNVPTRIQKLARGEYDAVVLAAAGVERLALELSSFRVFALNPRRWQPAPGQGAIAVEARGGDEVLFGLMAGLDHGASRRSTEWERGFLRVLEGGCTTPFGCYVSGDAAFLGRAGLDGEEAPWRAACVTLEADAQETMARGLAALDASTSFDLLHSPLPPGGAHAQEPHVPLAREL